MAKISDTNPLAQAGVQAFQDSMTKSLGAFTDLKQHGQRNVEAVTASVTVAVKGAESLGGMAVEFAKKATEDNIAAARNLSSAKSFQEAMELQMNFGKSFLDTYLAGVSKFSDALSATIRETTRPINERVAAVADQFQAPR